MPTVITTPLIDQQTQRGPLAVLATGVAVLVGSVGLGFAGGGPSTFLGADSAQARTVSTAQPAAGASTAPHTHGPLHDMSRAGHRDGWGHMDVETADPSMLPASYPAR